MNIATLAFVAGWVWAVLFTVLCIDYTDNDFDSSYNNFQSIINACSTANSTPVSFDKYEVTCKNGAVMKIANFKE